MIYYQLDDRKDREFEPDAEWVQRSKRTILCPRCELPRKEIKAVDVKVSRTPGDVAVSSCNFIGIVRIDFLEDLGVETARKALYFGKVFGPDGKPLCDYRTFNARKPMVLRNGPDSYHWVCEECGRFQYLPISKPYLSSIAVPKSAAILASGSDLLIEASLMDRIRPKWGRWLMRGRVAVIDTVRDGLPADMPTWPTEKQLIGYKPCSP